MFRPTLRSTCFLLAVVLVPVAASGAPAQQEEATAQAAREAQREREREIRKAAQEAREAAREAARRERLAMREARRQGAEQAETIIRTFKLPDGVVDLSNLSGNVIVTGTPGDTVKLEAVKRVWASDPDTARRLIENLKVSIVEAPNRLEIRTLHAGKTGKNAVDFKLTVPTRATLSIKTMSGDVTVSDMQGEVRAESVSGDVSTRNLTRLASLKSMSGDIEILASQLAGELAASSVSGDVIARDVKAQRLNIGSVSGDVTLSGVVSERAVVRSISGGVAFEGPLVKAGRYEIQSHSGDLRVAVDGKTGFEVDASTFNGSVRSELPLTVRGEVSGVGRGRSGVTRGVFGDGSAYLELVSFSGSIVIVKRQ